MRCQNEGRRSQTTISTIEEIATPQSSNREGFDVNVGIRRPVEGPRGPHLFRSSYASSEFSFDFALQLSPLAPKRQDLKIDTAFNSAPDGTPTSINETPAAVPNVGDDWNQAEPRIWTSAQVAMWMCNSGIDAAVIEKFEFHDITGTVLLDLQFQDLKELGIQSFGKRHQVWNQICTLRGGDGSVSPVPTPFQDTDRPVSTLSRSHSKSMSKSRSKSQDTIEDECITPATPGTGKRRRRKYRKNGEELITPADSVSIVAIEQLIPKPHKCAKGENCPKWKKQQRLLRRLHAEHGFPISPEKGGRVFIAGDPGNAATAPSLVENAYLASENEQSTIGPSVVASSDLLGPGEMPAVALHEDALKCVEERDPQENVKNFLTLQHVEPPAVPSPVDENQPSPNTLEMFPNYQVSPTAQQPLTNLQSLPRLTIPHANTFPQLNPYTGDFSGYQTAFQDGFSPCRTAVPSPPTIHRFATPASDMDVPVTAIPVDPYAREVTSQSVPPNMHFRDPVPRSRATSRRPSMPLPHINEGEIFSPTTLVQSSEHTSNRSSSTYSNSDELALSPKAASDGDRTPNPRDYRYPNIAHHGWMKKRKTKLLRHEWHDHHFRLAGTQLAMHASDHPSASALERLNIDEYAVACSSLASNKLAAKLKALKLSSDKEKSREDAKFLFQLVPTTEDGTEKGTLRRAMEGAKTHHFAVRTRDERIDWMRELMLAKALRAKKEGYAVEVNGAQV